MYEYSIYIGRFQPFHLAHLASVRFGLSISQKLIIVIGSDKSARNIKNPWSSAERIAMISACLSPEELERIEFVIVRDYIYNNNLWITSVQQAIRDKTSDSKNVVLIGYKKDDSSFYLKLFKEWKFLETGISMQRLDATKVRECLFRQDMLSLKSLVPGQVYEMLQSYMNSTEFKRLHEEFHHIEDYKAQWVGAPFPPTFVTVDAIVVCSGHVLVVRRRGAPGKGLVALPGGFLNQKEEIVDGALRELKEETCIDVPLQKLHDSIVYERVFSHPDRSLRGRTITHAYCIDLGHRELPKVKGSDDAEKAWWVPLSDALSMSDQFFDDHWHMLHFFTSRF